MGPGSFKSAAFPILIVLVLAFFASRLIANSNEAPKTDQFPSPSSTAEGTDGGRSARRTTQS